MIRCRICDREHEAQTKTCECGADLAVDGIAIGIDARFGDADLGDALPDLGDLPDLDAPTASFPGEGSLTDSLSIPDIDPPAPTPAAPTPPSAPPPAPTPSAEPPSAPPAPAPPAPRRDFAVKPTAGSGETRRGERPAGTEKAEARSPIAPLPIAPVIDPALASSVFADDDTDDDGEPSGWAGVGGLREGLRLERAGGVTACPTCGHEVPADRRFCRCGHQFEMPVLVPVEAANEPSRLTSFWRRISGTGLGPRGDERSWGQRAKDTGARRGMRYATRMSARTRFGRVGMLLAGGAGLIMVVGPLRQQVKGIPDLFEAAKPAEVAWTPEGLCDAPADEDIDNPWQTQWPSEGGSPDESGCPGVFDTITGTFAQPTDIDRLTLTIGATSGQTTVNRGQPVMSPAVVVLEFTRDGDRDPTVTDPIQLEDTAVQQEFGVKVRDAVGFTVTIIDVVGPDEHPWPELELVQIGQLAFFHD